MKKLIDIINNDLRKVIAEDFRKIGVYTLGISIAGVVLPNDDIPSFSAFLLALVGGYVWAVGIYLASSVQCKKSEDKE